MVLGVEPKASNMLAKCSTTETYSQAPLLAFGKKLYLFSVVWIYVEGYIHNNYERSEIFCPSCKVISYLLMIWFQGCSLKTRDPWIRDEGNLCLTEVETARISICF